MKNISAVVYETHGNPPDVLRLDTQPWPTPAADEVVVQMRAAPINPADLNAIEGKYPGDAKCRRCLDSKAPGPWLKWDRPQKASRSVRK